jgi:DNA mismatch repair ATPase MutS
MELQFYNKCYRLAAANALVVNVELTNSLMLAKKTLRVEYKLAEQTTIIDNATAEHIKLMNCLGQSRLSLLGVLIHCSTQGDAWLLRSNLFQPPINSKVCDKLSLKLTLRLISSRCSLRR